MKPPFQTDGVRNSEVAISPVAAKTSLLKELVFLEAVGRCLGGLDQVAAKKIHI